MSITGLSIFVYSKKSRMKRPNGSRLIKTRWALAGKIPINIFEPSSGGIGIRLNAPSVILIRAMTNNIEAVRS